MPAARARAPPRPLPAGAGPEEGEPDRAKVRCVSDSPSARWPRPARGSPRRVGVGLLDPRLPILVGRVALRQEHLRRPLEVADRRVAVTSRDARELPRAVERAARRRRVRGRRSPRRRTRARRRTAAVRGRAGRRRPWPGPRRWRSTMAESARSGSGRRATRTSMRLSVRVPVLSVAITVTEPSASTARAGARPPGAAPSARRRVRAPR